MADIEVPHPGASEIVGRLLSEALSEHPDVQWLGLVSEDGFAIASEGQAAVDDDAVAAGAVRMMIQVRAMAKALGQEGTSQMFLEGSDSGICVIDKDPWVLVMVGAPGVPIGLLRYEAREIADAFPMNRRAELEAAVNDDASQWWSAPEADEADAEPDTDEPLEEIRWADEPVSDDPSGVNDEQQVTDFIVVDPDGLGDLTVQDAAQPSFDLAPALTPEPEMTFDLAAADEAVDEVTFDLSAPDDQPVEEITFDLAPPADAQDEVSFDLAPPVVEDSEPPAMAAGFAVVDELVDLPAPSGPSIDLPPPAGPAFQLPPPV